jgi:hypothetical protein
MDGHFRRALLQWLDADAIEALDGLRSRGRSPSFALGVGAWRHPPEVALSGIRAAIDQACGWPEPVTNRFLLHFEPQQAQRAPSVIGLDAHWLEITCQAIFPDHPWLWR